jgi:Protein of unknown function (DUF1553)/Protein of unknown function (DUF1549)/Planctomycete cytochrome C
MRFLIFLSFVLSLPAYAAQVGKLRYNRDIRPILSDNCFACHGPDKNHREADLRLDLREAAIEMKAILPGNPDKSEVVSRLFTHDEDDLMPPAEFKKVLTAEQKNLITEWIKQGAEYEPHWAYTPLVKPALPLKKDNPIDAFIQAELAEKNISSSPQAEARSIIRRISLDLTGLPPRPAEVVDFVTEFQSGGTAATRNLISRLLKSPRFGERWAVWWLDVARFSDTVGFHGDQNQRIFPYRDYVINAFNSNMRFDQFTLEQLAGDLLPNASVEQQVASGFNRLNMMTREGGAQAQEYLTKYQADRVRTVGGAWLGATLGCCECHDHKFDPYKASDFYSMSAFFADVKQFGVYSQYRASESDELKGFSNDHPFPPEILVDSPYLKKRLEKIESEMLSVASAAAKAQSAGFAAWQKEMQSFLIAQPTGWIIPEPKILTVLAPPPTPKGAKPKAKTTDPKAPKPADESKAIFQPDGSLLFTAKGAQTTTLTFTPGHLTLAAIKIELLPSAAHQNSLILNGGDGSATITPEISFRSANAQKDSKITLIHAEADHYEPRYQGGTEIIGIQPSWKTRSREAKLPHSSIWQLNNPVTLTAKDSIILKLASHNVGNLRISFSPIAAMQPLAKNQPVTDASHWLTSAPSIDPALRANFHQRQAEARKCLDGKAWTQVTVAVKEPMVIRRLPRGNWMDETGEICPPAAPEFLAGKTSTTASRKTRIDLAKWLTSPENPLTARAFMNRLWKQFFGNGLSAATDDLGAQGETPSHPELLDWLACEFRESGWDIQHMMTLILTSQTYLQDSKSRPELKDIDPNNRLLAFQNPRRLDAEFVRDNALFAAGILNLEDIGGPSAKPYQPANYYENLQFPNRDYVFNLDHQQWRRGVYMHWQRTFLHPMLANFDAPARDESACNRNVSNTPQQALTLLNDPTFVEAARCFAEGLTGTDEEKITVIYQRTLSRQPKPAEKQSLLSFLSAQRAVFKASPEDAKKLLTTGLRPAPKGDPAELAAWTSLCRVALNLHESITRY